MWFRTETSCTSFLTSKLPFDMKTKVIVALATALAIMAGCATTMSLPDQLDKFVEKTEKEYKTYTEKEWEKSQEEYEELKAKINESYDSFSTSDKVRTMKAMGKYGSFVLEKELAGASETIGSVLESIPQTINDIIDEIDTTAIREGVEGVKKGIEGIIESVDTARLRKSVEGLTESIDTAKLREKLEALIKIFGEEE